MENTFSGGFQTSATQIIGSHINAASIYIGQSPAIAQDKKKWLLDSLKFDQIDHRRSAIREAYHETCEWLLDEPEYRAWFTRQDLGHHNGFLWIKGKPGSGKSTLMSYALNDARKKLKGTPTTIVSFFFNARGSELEKSTIGMYRSLLWQILKHKDIEFISKRMDAVLPDFHEHSSSPSWTIELLETLVKEVVRELQSPFVCFIDALDECDEDQIRTMVSLFQQIGRTAVQPQFPFQICFSSRHYPHITTQRAQELVLEGRLGHSQDIAKYIDSELNIGTGSAAEEIKIELRQKSGGIFMWAVLVVSLLNKAYDRGRVSALRRELQAIPKDLSMLFRQLLARDNMNTEQTLLCIQWVLFSRSPLTPKQLYVAVLCGTEPEANLVSDLAQDEVQKFILASSKGLAEITNSFSTVQFIHESVRDFLLKEHGLRDLWHDVGDDYIGQSHEQLKLCCLAYLTWVKENVLPSVTLANDPRLLTWKRGDYRESFLHYAVAYILFHADTAAACSVSQDTFLESFDRKTWIQLGDLIEFPYRYTPQVSLLYILAQLNMHHLIRIYPLNQSYLEVEPESCDTPLYVALRNGNAESVLVFLELQVQPLPEEHRARKLLKEYCRHIINPAQFRIDWNRSYWSPTWFPILSPKRDVFHQLADCGSELVLEIFMRTLNINLDLRGESGKTPLMRAAGSGHLRIVDFLLKNGEINVNSKDYWGETPLSIATANSEEEIVRLLLTNHRLDINSKNNKGKTALSVAAAKGRVEILKLLLSHDQLDINSKDNAGKTALHSAALRARYDVCRLLLRNNKAEVNPRDCRGRTPLHLASLAGAENVVKLLLCNKQVDVHSGDSRGRTPLHLASLAGAENVVKLLLCSKQVDVHSRDSRGRTPLHMAVAIERDELRQALMENEEIANSLEDNEGITPGIDPIIHEHEWIASRSLENGQLVATSRDRKGQTPLHLALRGHSTETIVRLLHQRYGADINAIDAAGNSVLSVAVQAFRARDVFERRFSILNVVKYLLEFDHVELDIGNELGLTPLAMAAREAFFECVELFLATHTVVVDSKDHQGRTALSWASQKYIWGSFRPIETVRLLLKTGQADPSSRDCKGRTPLWYAAGADMATVELLLATGQADPGVRDIYGISPVQVAAWRARKSTVVRLLEIADIEIEEGDWEFERRRVFLPDNYLHPTVGWGAVVKESFQLLREKWLSRQQREQSRLYP